MEVEGEYQQTKFIFEVPKIGFLEKGLLSFPFFYDKNLKKKKKNLIDLQTHLQP